MTSANAFRRKMAVAVAIALATAAANESAAQSTPTRTGYADVEGGRIAYQVYGDLNSGKTPLLVLHGLKAGRRVHIAERRKRAAEADATT